MRYDEKMRNIKRLITKMMRSMFGKDDIYKYDTENADYDGKDNNDMSGN